MAHLLTQARTLGFERLHGKARRYRNTQTGETISYNAFRKLANAKRLAVHAADLRRRPSVHSVSNRCQRQKPPALVDVLRPPGQPAQAPPPNSPLAI